jgi:hypothetical protein
MQIFQFVMIIKLMFIMAHALVNARRRRPAAGAADTCTNITPAFKR